MAYALPNATDTEDLFTIMRYVNTVSDGFFFPLILGAIYAISFLILSYQVTPPKAFLFTGFICTILSIILATLGLINPRYVYMVIISLAVGVLWVMFDNNE